MFHSHLEDKDNGLRIAEWFEIVNALGATKIDLKTVSTNKNINNVGISL